MTYNNSYLIRKFFLVIFLTFYLQNFLIASDTNIVNIHKSTKYINLFDYIKILEDKNNNLTINDIVKSEYSSSFKPTSVVGNTFGISSSAYWIKFSIKIDQNVDDSLYLELAYPLMDYATLYIPNDDGAFDIKSSGEFIPASQKEVNYRNHLFRILNNTQSVCTYYMYVKSAGSTQIPLHLFTSTAFIENVDKRNFIFGGYYGNMTLLMIATFVAFFKIRDTLFLTYGIYLVSYLFFQLSINGFFSQFFSPVSLKYSNEVTHLSLVLVVIGGALFSGNYLQIWKNKYPKIKFLFYLLIVHSVVGFIIALIFNHGLGVKMSVISGLFLPPVVLLGAIYSLYSGYKPARYFLAAWSIFLFGIFVSGLVFLGYIPYTFITAYSMQIGSTLELLLLSYALIDRINILYDEKEKATQNATKYLNQINEGLESLVTERTEELEKKNKLLSELAIKDSMTSMLNHNSSIERLSNMKSAALRYNYKLSVIMIDIDLFKLINDTYGHPAGDQVIIKIANVIHKIIRKSDTAGRYGGEEFILLLHNIDEKTTMDLAERIRLNIESLRIPEINFQAVSASFGVSIFDANNPDTDIIKKADNALYEAKSRGRNRVIKYKE